MITLYEIDQLATLAGVSRYEIILCAYEQGFELSWVAEGIAKTLLGLN